MAGTPNPDLAALSQVASSLSADAATVGRDAAVAQNQFAALAQWVVSAHPGATVSQMVRDPFCKVILPPFVPTLTSIKVQPTLAWYAKAAGTRLGISLNINYQNSPDNTYPWDQVYLRGCDEVANCGGLCPEEVVFQDVHLVPTVTNTTTITTSFTSADAQVAFMATFGLRPLIYILPNPAYSGYATAISNAGGTSAAALQMMTTVINAIVGHYAGKADYVLFNELIQFGAYNANPFTTAMGTNASTGAVASAIQLIHAADPTAKIWLNTNHIETNSDASSWSFFLAQASALKAANAALTGVSFESHLVASAGAAVYTQLTSRVVAARAAGLDASIGELDVTDDTQLAAGPAGQVARDAIAAAIVSAYLTNFLAGGTPDHIICWQLTDGSSWLNSPPRPLAGTTSSLFERQQHTTDGDSFTVAGQTFFAHTPSPTGAAMTASGNQITVSVFPAVGTTITGGQTVTYTPGLTGGTLVAIPNLVTNGTQTSGATTLTLSGTSLTGTVQPGTQGRHTVGFDTAGVRKPAYFAVQAALQAAAGGALPSAQSAVIGETQRYYADGDDQNNGILAVQPTMQWHTSNSGVATVPNNGQTVIASLTGSGTTNITATSALITSNTQVLTVSGPTNEPSGMTVAINGNAMTAPPATTQNGTWSQNGVTWTMFSPSGNFNSANDDASRLTIDPGGLGWRVTYPTTLAGGSSAVRFGTPINPASPGGVLYVRRNVSFSSNWTNPVATGTKNAEPHTTAPQSPISGAAENHILYYSYNATGNNTIMQPMVQLQGPNGQARNLTVSPSNVGVLSGGASHLLEELLIQEGTPGTAAGSYMAWVDGVLAANYTNVQYLFSGQSKGWVYFLRDIVWGGTGSNPPQQQYWTENNLYMSVK